MNRQYLDKFRSKIPQVQSKQIMGILQDLQTIGAIRTVKEYNERLTQLTEVLRATDPRPFFKLFSGIVGEVISSDKFNAMVRATQRDLETVFQELAKIGEVLELHKQLYDMSILKSFRQGLRELTEKIGLYEFLATTNYGFTTGQYNTFAAVNGNRLLRSDIEARSLYIDPKTGQELPVISDCLVDVFDHKLIMPVDVSREYTVADIGLVEDADTTSSVRKVWVSDKGIYNVVDKTKDTYWSYPILTPARVVGGAKIKLRFDLGGFCDINTIKIEPASSFPMTLDTITYVGEDNNTDTVTVNRVLNDTSSISFDAIRARYITLAFVQNSYERALYHKNEGRDLCSVMDAAAISGNYDYQSDGNSIGRIEEEIAEEVQDEGIRSLVGVSLVQQFDGMSYFQYTFGFDNIRFYSHTFRNTGIFVGSKLKVDSPGILGLQVSEESPTIAHGTGEVNTHSFEYYIAKRDYDTNGSFLRQEILPVLPIDRGRVIEHERIVLSKRFSSNFYNGGVLQFVPDIDAATPSIYSNRYQILVPGVDYYIKVGDNDWRSSWSAAKADIYVDAAVVSPPLLVYIRVTEPSPFAIFTINYTALTRDSAGADAAHLKIADTVRMTDYSTLMCDRQKELQVGYSDLYCIAIIRNNWIDSSQTASLLDYRLLANSYDPQKFAGED